MYFAWKMLIYLQTFAKTSRLNCKVCEANPFTLKVKIVTFDFVACSFLILWLILKKFTPLKNIYISFRPMLWTFTDATSIIFNNGGETRHETTITIIINVLLVFLPSKPVK